MKKLMYAMQCRAKAGPDPDIAGLTNVVQGYTMWCWHNDDLYWTARFRGSGCIARQIDSSIHLVFTCSSLDETRYSTDQDAGTVGCLFDFS